MNDLLEKQLIDLKSEKTRLESEYISNNTKIRALNTNIKLTSTSQR